MKRSKYRTTKRLFYAGLIFTSLSLFSAGFASFNIYGGQGSVQGKIDIGETIQINITQIENSNVGGVINYRNGFTMFGYSQLGFATMAEGIDADGNTFIYYYYDGNDAKTKDATMSMYFNIESNTTINNYDANIALSLKQNNNASFDFFSNLNTYNANVYFGNDAEEENTFLTTATPSKNNPSITSFNQSINLIKDQPLYFKIEQTFSFSNSQNFDNFYNWISNLPNNVTPFTFDVTMIVTQGGN